MGNSKKLNLTKQSKNQINMFKLEIGEVLNMAWELAKKNWLKLTLLNLIYLVIAMGISIAFLPEGFIDAYLKTFQGDQNAANRLISMAENGNFMWQSIISALFQSICATIAKIIYLKAVRNKGVANIADGFSKPMSTYIKCAGVSFVLSLVTSAWGLLSETLPTIVYVIVLLAILYVYIRCYLSIFVMIENEDDTIGDALKSSWEITKGYTWPYIVVLLASMLIMLVGVIACCVGVLFAMVIAMFATAVTYAALADKKNPTIFDLEA